MRRQDTTEAPQTPVEERMAHRALGLIGPRAASSMSEQARDRLYERMFPQHICGSYDDACSD